MTERFKAVIDNDYYTTSNQYWKVIVEANNLNTLNNICSTLHLIKKNEVEK